MRFRSMLALAAALGLLLGVPTLAAADEMKFQISDGRLANLSGLAADGSALWATNKNDDQARAYWLDPASGKVKRTTTEAKMKGCDAIAIAGSDMYLADLTGSKASVKLVRFPKPEPSSDPAAGEVKTFTLKYPDGNQEGQVLLVSGTGQVFVVASGKVYSAPATLAAGENALTKVAEAPKGITGGTNLPDGSVLLRSADEVFAVNAQWQVTAKAKIEGAGAGSAIAATSNGIYLAASGARQKIYFKPLSDLKADGAAPAPAPVSPPPAASAPTVPPSTASPVVPPSASTRDNSGTILAILAAALVAGGAGLIVFVKR